MNQWTIYDYPGFNTQSILGIFAAEVPQGPPQDTLRRGMAAMTSRSVGAKYDQSF